MKRAQPLPRGRSQGEVDALQKPPAVKDPGGINHDFLFFSLIEVSENIALSQARRHRHARLAWREAAADQKALEQNASFDTLARNAVRHLH